MEKGFESWFQDQQIDRELTGLNSSTAPFGLFHRFVDMFSPNPSGENPQFLQNLGFQHHGLTAGVNSILKEQIPESFNAKIGAGNGVRKTFLVFDQSNDHTTLIYSSDIEAAPIRYNLPTWNDLRPQPTFQPKNENLTSHVDEHGEENEASEMREDTEELNALLYSDDEIDYSEDEEEMSTGHSPSSITGFEKRQERDADDDAVVSSGPRKKRKFDSNGSYDAISLEDTASSGVNCSNGAELSGSGGGNGAVEEESGGDKRSRKEKVRETIRILSQLIPGDKNGKDAVMIIDEAIQYLRSLKVKVKALGLDTL